jgi:hypothetical protein
MQDLEIYAQPSFEKNDDEGNGGKDRAYSTEVFGCDEVKNRAK